MGFLKNFKEDLLQAADELITREKVRKDADETSDTAAFDSVETAAESVSKVEENAVNIAEAVAIQTESEKEKRIGMEHHKYGRVLLKLSGEALAGDKKTGYDEQVVIGVAKQVKTLTDSGVEVGIVIGGGNFWRGRTSNTIDRSKADQIGMLATVMNCIYVSEIFRHVGIDTLITTPFTCGAFSELYSKDRVMECLKEKKTVFFAGGTGHPYFSTDMATALRAVEIEADIILAARAVDGVYDSDPDKNPDAKKFKEISMKDIVARQLGVMDLASAVLCMENKMPMIVFGLNEENSIVNAAGGNSSGTVISAE